METYMRGEVPERDFEVVESVEGVRCEGGFGRVVGGAEGAIEFLKERAAILEADAVVNIQCGKAPLVNNCWAAAKCEGIAVRWTE